MKNIISLLGGVIFGAGLVISGMADPNRVLGFLDVFGPWDPALLLVMCSALAVSIPGFYFVKKLKQPICDTNFSLPQNSIIDNQLIGGAIIFGLGWGLAGICPGPALARLSQVSLQDVYFVGAMFAGIYIHQFLFSKRA